MEGNYMEICTERCLIRQFEEKDIADFMAYRNDMDWMKYQGFKGLTQQEYKNALLGKHTFQEGVQFAVICKKSGVLIGDVYLKQEGDSFWIGYSICRTMARQGYAYEVASAVIGSLRDKSITCIKAGVECGNIASAALLKKLGFCYIGMDNDEQIFVLSF